MYTNSIIYVLIFTSAYIFVVKSLEYSDLEIMGITCEDKISCNAIDRSNFTKRNCECDSDCGKYNDCCVDAIRRPLSRKSSAPMCMPYGDGQNVGVYAINTCSSRFTGVEEIRHKCQNPGDISDPVMAAPVTDTVNKRTFWNSYCAECNNIALENLQTWLIDMSCNVPGIDENNVWQNIIYRQDLNKWGINSNQGFHACDLTFVKQRGLRRSTRLCRPNIISTCPSDYTRRDVKRNCELYTAVMYTRGKAVYKNPHCALCHGLSVDALNCDIGSVFEKKKPFTFRDLININKSEETNKHNCRADQKYDPYYNKCRNIVCALPGYTKIDGKCTKSS